MPAILNFKIPRSPISIHPKPEPQEPRTLNSECRTNSRQHKLSRSRGKARNWKPESPHPAAKSSKAPPTRLTSKTHPTKCDERARTNPEAQALKPKPNPYSLLELPELLECRTTPEAPKVVSVRLRLPLRRKDSKATYKAAQARARAEKRRRFAASFRGLQGSGLGAPGLGIRLGFVGGWVWRQVLG